MAKIFRILSIDGGGIRGIYPAYILRCIEERLKMNLLDTFDMIAGTSTGSIVAAGVATGVPAAEIVAMYKKHGAKIFRKKNFFCRSKLLHLLFDSFYDTQYLKGLLSEVFRDKRLGDIEKPLLLPAADIGNGRVHVLKSSYHEDFTRDNNVMLKDAILASCSAPIYFDPYRLDEYLLADGGLWANNPALIAMIDAQKRLGIAQDDIRILSIGTGHSKIIYGTNTSRKWGLWKGWKLEKFTDFIFSLQNQSVVNYLGLMLRPNQIKRVDFDSDQPLSLDDVSILDDIVSKADHKFTHETASIKEFLNPKTGEIT